MAKKSDVMGLYLLQMIFNLIPIITAILIFLYLGYKFDDDKAINPADAKRKWLILFAWFTIIAVILNLITKLTIIRIYNKK